MQGSPFRCIALWLLLSLSVGCQCAQSPTNNVLKNEGDACDADEDCVTSLCDKLPGKPKVCFRRCASGCKANEVCTSLSLNDRFVCVPERAGLCQACSLNIDCPYPGDRCGQIGGSNVCTRDCAFDGQCPTGYRCSSGLDTEGNSFVKQCQPSSGSCDCTVASAGQTKPCEATNSFGTCAGTQTCHPPEGYDTCNAPIAQAEVCNSRDDDCDGQIDEGMGEIICGVGECQRKVSSCGDGGVDQCMPGAPSAEVCDGKDNDCDGVIDNGVDTTTSIQNCGACFAVCSKANATPACVAGHCQIGTCLPNFWDLDGNPDNGCEYACTFSSAIDEPDDAQVDSNCDGLDGEWNNSVFVAPPSAGGDDDHPGTRAAPKATITAGLSAAVVLGKRDVLVAGGAYVEAVTISVSGKGVFGGYAAGTWARSASSAVTVTGMNSPLRITSVTGATVQRISFIGASATGPGDSSYGGFIIDSQNVRLDAVVLSAGPGPAGANGVAGAMGQPGGPGDPGAPGCERSTGLLCGNCAQPPAGAGGTSACGRTGGQGGAPGLDGNPGSPGEVGVGGTPGGLGTPAEQGDWLTPEMYWGRPGATPVDPGSPGSSGASFGTLTASGYIRAATASGGKGIPGNGGGGGGGGGGGLNNCNSFGASGGGGGAGGCGGVGGTAGVSGGGSMGLYLWNSTVQATGCSISSAPGGKGGNGGSGGPGGPGGAGGLRNTYGGSSQQDDGSNGGSGGRGGDGSAGGPGGAGSGGPSLGVARGGGAVWTASRTTISVAPGGQGGTSDLGPAPMGLSQDVY